MSTHGERGVWPQMGPPVIRLLPQGDKSSPGAAVHPDGWIVVQIRWWWWWWWGETVDGDIWVSGLRGDSMGQEGTCCRLAAAALPPDLTHPRVCLLLSLCPGGM